MDEAFVRLYEREESFLGFEDRRLNIEYEMLERSLETARRYIDIVMIGEDLGTQIGPIISRELYGEEIKPRHKRFVDLAKSYGKLVMFHCRGSSSRKPPMWSRPISRSSSATGALSFGTADDVEADRRQILEIMMPGGGYCFCPAHQIQDNTPTENVVRMYDSVLGYGCYT